MAGMDNVTYGHGYRGMDPRDFKPDEQCCTPEEIGRWQEAVARANAGLPWEDVKPPLVIEGREVQFYTGGRWGVGIVTWPDDGRGEDGVLWYETIWPDEEGETRWDDDRGS